MKIKILLVSSLAFLALAFKNSDGKQFEAGIVTYKIGRIINTNAATKTRSEEQRTHIQQASAAFAEMEFVLKFNRAQSLFSIVDKLYNAEAFAVKTALSRVKGVYFKDAEKGEKVKHHEFLGAFYSTPVEEYKWTITTETKMISGYRCYKAVCVVEEFDSIRKKSLVFNPEVWFAPEIPVPFGPAGLDGLPGLVLEGRFSTGIYYFADAINFETKTIKLERPKNGKHMTREEFQKVQIQAINN